MIDSVRRGVNARADVLAPYPELRSLASDQTNRERSIAGTQQQNHSNPMQYARDGSFQFSLDDEAANVDVVTDF